MLASLLPPDKKIPNSRFKKNPRSATSNLKLQTSNFKHQTEGGEADMLISPPS
jgi:hypothetical protein